MNVTKRVAYVPVTVTMLHRTLSPWEYPDRPPRFEIRLFPRWIEWLHDHTTDQEAE